MKNISFYITPTLITIALIIEVISFYHLGHYVDQYGTSPSIVLGGQFWLYAKWLKLLLLFIATIWTWSNSLRKQ